MDERLVNNAAIIFLVDTDSGANISITWGFQEE